jgi:predicted CopG family antitoxin
MSTHTVALDAEAYTALKAMKQRQESFSDVVKRLAKPRRSILEFAGAWKDIPDNDWKILRESYRRTREADRRRAERLQAMWDRQ